MANHQFTGGAAAASKSIDRSVDTAATLPLAPVAESARVSPDEAQFLANWRRLSPQGKADIADFLAIIQEKSASAPDAAAADNEGEGNGDGDGVFVPAGAPATAETPSIDELTQGGKDLAESLVKQLEVAVRAVHAQIDEDDDRPNDTPEDFMADGILNLFDGTVPNLNTRAVRGHKYPLDAVGVFASHLGKLLFHKKCGPRGYQREDRTEFEYAFRIAQVYLRACRDASRSKRQRKEFGYLLLAAAVATYRVAKADGKKDGAA